MRRQVTIAIAAGLGFFLVGCSSRQLPKYEKPIARTQFQKVRTTAYTHTESDHRKHGRRTALGTRLRAGPIHSAAADWSRWPAGTLFRIVETGELFEVDDYGWALSGTNTIDLYKTSRSAMNRWGVRHITIENLRWGDPTRSLAVLRSRSRFRHVKRMVDGFADHYPTPPTIVAEQRPPEAEPVRVPTAMVARAQAATSVHRATAAAAPSTQAPRATGTAPARRATLAPFYSAANEGRRAKVQ